MDDVERRGRSVRSFLVGSIIGASAMAVARRRARRRRELRLRGLGAFESAPCYREPSERSREDDP